MHIFHITHARCLGTRLGWYMAKPDRALKRPCDSAGSIITAVKTPANAKPSSTGSQKSRATQMQTQAQTQAVCLPPRDSVTDGAAAPQKQGSKMLAHFKAGIWFFNHCSRLDTQQTVHYLPHACIFFHHQYAHCWGTLQMGIHWNIRQGLEQVC